MKVVDIFWIFLKLGLSSFGGPVAHLAYFRTTFVERKKWFSEAQYAHLLTVCQTLPGPASSQVGFAVGLLRGGWLGGLSAFIAFTLPSVVLLLLFANSLYLFESEIGQAGLKGLAILAFLVVTQAVIGMSKQLLSVPITWCLALAMFSLVLLSNSLIFQFIGIVLCAICCAIFAPAIRDSEKSQGDAIGFSQSHFSLSLKTSWIASTIFVVISLLVLANPLNINAYFYEHAAAYYSSGAMVFGGGHVVLPFLEQATVSEGLVTKDAFLAGYGATQAMPGPMFSFAAYLGYMGELHQQTMLSSQSATLSALGSAFWATLFIFLPGFLLLAAVLPISQKLFEHPKLSSAFMGANAAVVGLLAATLYDPIFVHAIQSKEDLVIAAIGFIALTRFKIPMLALLCLCLFLSVAVASFM